MSVNFNDIDVMAFEFGGQFFEDDVVDEVLACVTDGQFGVELEEAVVPTIPVARSTGGGGGGGVFRYVVPVGECLEWDKRNRPECDPVTADMDHDWKPPRKGKETAPWERVAPMPPAMAGFSGVPERSGLDLASVAVGALAGAAVAVLAVWLYKRWSSSGEVSVEDEAYTLIEA